MVPERFGYGYNDEKEKSEITIHVNRKRLMESNL
jgi:hypothetical protein